MAKGATVKWLYLMKAGIGFAIALGWLWRRRKARAARRLRDYFPLVLAGLLLAQETILGALQVVELRQTPLRVVCDEYSRLEGKPVIVPVNTPDILLDLPPSAVSNDFEAGRLLDEVLRANGFCMKAVASAYVLSTDCAETQKVATISGALVDARYQLKHALPSDIVPLLDSNILVRADTRLHALLIEGTESNVERALRFTVQADAPLQQIQLDALITEVTITSNDNSAVNIFQRVIKAGGAALSAGSQSGQAVPVNLFGAKASLPNALDVTGAGSLWLSLKHVNLDVLASVLQGDSRFNIVSRPIVRVLDGHSADLVIGQSRPYVSSALQQTIGGFSSNSTVVASQVTYIDTATELHVTPRIADDGRVDMLVAQAANEFGGTVSLPSGDVPILDKRTITTTVSATDGETIVLGGLMRHEDDASSQGLPGVRHLPVVGRLFDERNKSANSTELLVFLKPTVIK